MDNKAETANSGSNNFEGEQEVNPNNTNGLTEQVIAEEADSDSDLSQHQQQHALSRTRTPFTNLGQVEADLALARRLQEQVLSLNFTNFRFISLAIVLVDQLIDYVSRKGHI